MNPFPIIFYKKAIYFLSLNLIFMMFFKGVIYFVIISYVL